MTNKKQEDMRKVKVFCGSSHPDLSKQILDRLGIDGAPATLKKGKNAEMAVELGVSVRDQDVFIVQSGSTAVNDHLMELLIMINAAKTNSASRITAVIPYFPYSKQSKKKKGRGTITAKLVANMLAVSGVDHIITMDLHSSQIQGFFSKPVDNLVSEPSFTRYIKENYDLTDVVIVSKNSGGTKRVTNLADKLGVDFAMIHRERYHIEQDQSSNVDDDGQIETRLTLVGDVKGKTVFLMDDIIDGTHSFIDACKHLKTCEAKTVIILASHGILSGDALKEIEESLYVDELVITNTYPLAEEQKKSSTKLRIIDISVVFAEAIRRTHNGESISYLFHTAL